MNEAWTMRDKFINSNLDLLIEFSSSRRSIEFKDVIPWNISHMITKTNPISTRIVISFVMKRGIPFWVWRKVNGNSNNNMIRIRIDIQCRTYRRAIRNKFKTAELWESWSGIREGLLLHGKDKIKFIELCLFQRHAHMFWVVKYIHLKFHSPTDMFVLSSWIFFFFFNFVKSLWLYIYQCTFCIQVGYIWY